MLGLESRLGVGVAGEEQAEFLREHVVLCDRVPGCAGHFLGLVARLGNPAEIALREGGKTVGAGVVAKIVE